MWDRVHRSDKLVKSGLVARTGKPKPLHGAGWVMQSVH